MATSYPTALDTFSNPASGDALNSASVPHAAQHANANDAIEAIETLLGANGANYVSVAGAQTITGTKTYSAIQTVNANIVNNGNLQTNNVTDLSNIYTFLSLDASGVAITNRAGVNVPGLRLLMPSGHTALLLDLQVAGSSKLNVASDGKLSFPGAGLSSPSASAGASGAVPAQVVGYLVFSINGVDRKIPYFAS